MKHPPKYFERIRANAARRWNQLESDAELAAPWHQLFKQVQSPRHVVSELLQNADDAKASEATIVIEDRCFVFEHNGIDFTPDHFASLCRFGYSNKRTLHTIGFRGIGFKSCFSLGPQVDLHTPTLSVRFHRSRFTEPVWIPSDHTPPSKTTIIVAIADQRIETELRRNLEEWLCSPVSLLFFKRIRQMTIGGNVIHWRSAGAGPVSRSEWMSLDENLNGRHLLLRSEEAPLPPEAMLELRQERLLGDSESMEFPPCKVEIVLGVPGRLHVVLPTGVETKLPFAANAPFVQDPARLKIKDPETSPTNRWLLDRIGLLAAEAFTSWVGNCELSFDERAASYDVMPGIGRSDNTLSGVCASRVAIAFGQHTEGSPLLLSSNGELVAAKEAYIVPPQLFSIWSAKEISAFAVPDGRPTLSQFVSPENQAKLENRQLIDRLSDVAFFFRLSERRVPKPNTWAQLLLLWRYIGVPILTWQCRVDAYKIQFLPVEGGDVLSSPTDVVRLGEKGLLKSQSDFTFLQPYLRLIDHGWLRHLSHGRRRLSGKDAELETAYKLLEHFRLDRPTDASLLIDRIASKFFRENGKKVHECVRLAQIAAKLDVQIGTSFFLVTRDCQLRAPGDVVCRDIDSYIEFIPEGAQDSCLLHDAYSAQFESCTKEEWFDWISSGKAQILAFIPIEQRQHTISSRKSAETWARDRGFAGSLSFHYKTNEFTVEDWDFDESFWSHWLKQAKEGKLIWPRLGEALLLAGEAHYRSARSARIHQVATTGNTQPICVGLRPSWICRLQELPCLPDTKLMARKPRELLRRTPTTEALLDVEPFVKASLDTESTRSLLDLLGVRSEPTGPHGVLERLRALSKTSTPPIREVEKWYERLDQLVQSCSADDIQEVKSAFQSDRLILARDSSWVSSQMVFIEADEYAAPGAPVIRPEVSDLNLWRRIGVPEKPTAELAINWLKKLPAGGLADADVTRVQELLARYPGRIWEECEHWLNLAREWKPTAHLRFALMAAAESDWTHLDAWVKQATADFRKVPSDCRLLSVRPLLLSQIEERLRDEIQFRDTEAEEKPWLRTVGECLQRVRLSDEAQQKAVSQIGARLARTMWCQIRDVRIVPYIDGRPAGRARPAMVAWVKNLMFVGNLPKGKLARLIPAQIGKGIGQPDVVTALHYSFERGPEEVRSYFEENFELIAAKEVKVAIGPQIDVHSPEEHRLAHDEARLPIPPEPTESRESHEAQVTISDDQSPPTRGLGGGHRSPSTGVFPSLFERFASSRGFRKEGQNRFRHQNGEFIARVDNSIFPWQRFNRSGDLLVSYWVKDVCLEREPLQIESEVWDLVERSANLLTLILCDPSGKPIEVSGAELRRLVNEGNVSIFTASYRLVYADHAHA